MSKYIDADKLIESLQHTIEYLKRKYGNDCSVAETLEIVCCQIQDFSITDVHEVKHGKWIEKNDERSKKHENYT